MKFIALLTLVGTAQAFTSPQRVPRTCTSLASSSDYDVARIQNEFKELRDQLMQSLTASKGTPAMEVDEIATVILEKSAELAAFQKYKQAEMVEDAEAEYRHAHGDVEMARTLHDNAAQDAAAAEMHASMVESIDADYEDRERLRNLAVAHAAHQVEHDAHELQVESQFKELEAESKRDEAARLLQQFEQYERELKVTRKELEAFKRDKAMKAWSKEQQERQQALIRSAKKQLQTYQATISVFSSQHIGSWTRKEPPKQPQLKVTPSVEDFAEEILTQAADVAAVQKNKMADMLQVAEAECHHAHGDVEQAQALHRQAAQEASSAEEQAAMLESIDAGYEDRERKRDLAIAHANHQLEHDAHNLEVEAQFHEVEAELKRDEAAHLFQQFEEHERDLKAILQELQDLKKGKAMQDWSNEKQSQEGQSE
jgi:hypothetical protein